MSVQQFPAGFWPSLLSAEAVAKGRNALGFPLSAQQWIFWQENLADQGNRCVLRGRPWDLRQPARTFTTENHALGSRVHEYGGCAYAVADIAGRLVAAFVNKADQTLYVCHDLLNLPRWEILFQQDHGALGDLQLCPWGVVLVVEHHHPHAQSGSLPESLPENYLLFCDWQGRGHQLHQGQDFYAGVQFSADFSRLAFLGWQRPHMPWDQCTLWTLRIRDKAGTPQFSRPDSTIQRDDVATFQPMFDGAHRLHYVADVQGFAQLYREQHTGSLLDRPWEFGLPLWQLGMRSYALLRGGGIAACAADQGVWRLGYLHTHQNAPSRWQDIALDGAHVAQPVAAGEGFAALIMPQDSDEYIAYFPPGCVHVAEATPIASSTPDQSPAKPWVVKPALHHFAGCYGAVQGYWYLPPGLGDRPPPVIIRSHGGPSGQTDPAYRAKYQYWLTRGFALFDINYSGSTGFGREYRKRLDLGWGIVDRDDCLDGLRDLLQRGWVDGDHAFISGSSAGGLTTLNCLCHSDLFAAGVSIYGVADLLGLARGTHKFEADYLDMLVGPLPEAEQEYIQRSPLHQAGNIRVPMLFLHGGKDPVVPISQMMNMVSAIRQQHPEAVVEVEIFPDEGHGFRDPQTVALALERECAFYRRFIG